MDQLEGAENLWLDNMTFMDATLLLAGLVKVQQVRAVGREPPGSCACGGHDSASLH